METDDDFTSKLRDVFDLCDTEKRGFISVDYFVDLAKKHFCSGDWNSSHEALSHIISILDSDGNGRINFEEFCKGVRHIQGSMSPIGSFGGNATFEFQNIETDMMDKSVEDINDFGTNYQTSEIQTYNDYEIGDDCLPPLSHSENHLYLHLGSSEDDVDSGFSNKSNDHYDFKGCWLENIEEVRTHGHTSDEKSPESSFFYDHVKLTPNMNSNRATPVSFNSQTGSIKRLTPSAVASQLYRNNSSLNTSRRSSLSDGGVYDDLDGNFTEMNDKIKKLEDQVNELGETQTRNDEKHLRMKEENSTLVERVHLLEEQLREIEQRAHEQLTDEQKKHREALMKTDKEKSREIEILSQSLQHIEREYSMLREEIPLLRTENERLRRENHQLEKETERLNQMLSDLADEHKALQDHFHAEQVKTAHENKVHTQLIDELSKELDELRQYRAEAQIRASPVMNTDLPHSHRKEMVAQIAKLKQENMILREQSEDLQAQLLSRHILEGRSLLQQSETSLATEFNKLPKDELMKALQKEQEANKKLREYVEQITLRILEKNPSILEVNSRRK